MNYIDIAFIAAAVIMVIAGASRGLIVSLLSTLKYIVGIPLSYFVSGLLYERLYDGFVRDVVYDRILEEITASASAENMINGIKEFVNGLPENLVGEFDLSALSGLTAQQFSASLTDSVLEPVILTALRIILFVVLFIVFCIIVSVLISAFSKMQKKKHAPLKHTNRFFGGVFGLLKAALLVFTASTIIGYVCGILPAGNSFVTQANNSFLLEFINHYNPFIKI